MAEKYDFEMPDIGELTGFFGVEPESRDGAYVSFVVGDAEGFELYFEVHYVEQWVGTTLFFGGVEAGSTFCEGNGRLWVENAGQYSVLKGDFRTGSGGTEKRGNLAIVLAPELSVRWGFPYLDYAS